MFCRSGSILAAIRIYCGIRNISAHMHTANIRAEHLDWEKIVDGLGNLETSNVSTLDEWSVRFNLVWIMDQRCHYMKFFVLGKKNSHQTCFFKCECTKHYSKIHFLYILLATWFWTPQIRQHFINTIIFFPSFFFLHKKFYFLKVGSFWWGSSRDRQ